MIILLDNGTCAWWTNIWTTWSIKFNLCAPFGGLICWGVAMGLTIPGKIKFINTATITDVIINFLLLYIIYK